MPESPARNAPCPCGSAKRYKHCCGALGTESPLSRSGESGPQSSGDRLNPLLAEAVQAYQRFDFRHAAALCARVFSSAFASDFQKLAAAEVAGSALTRLNDHLGARDYYLAALALDPTRTETLHNLGLNAVHLGDFELALEYSGKLLSIDPGNTNAYNDMANALRELGRWVEAKEIYQRLVADGSADETIYGSLLLALHYTPASGDEIYQAHVDWAKRCAPASNMSGSEHRNEVSANRKLRIGYFSQNFSRKIAGYFFKPLIENHDRGLYELYLYSNTDVEDDYTNIFRNGCDKWVDVRQLSPAETAETIRADRIDIMVDLAGHSPGNILTALSYKPAPVQVTMLDYFDTTGVAAIDYFISDAYHSPEGSRQRFVEKLVRLPGIRLCYQPVDIAPPVRALPAVRNGHISFGSFNRRQKVTREVLELWSRVLASVPASRLILKGSYFDKPTVQRDVLAGLSGNGVDETRIEFRGRSHHRQALDEYGDVDIALDTFPWNGGLTTCEALLMGVPVIALRGDRIISRQSAAMLHAVGLDEFVAESPEQYVEIARRQSADLDALSRLRDGLRDRLLESALCDASGYTRNLEDFYRRAWREWCAERERR